MTILFIVAIAVFGYMCFVLLKPEKFWWWKTSENYDIG